MDKKQRIENSLRDGLSIVLGRVDSLDHAEFIKRFRLLVDSAAARSAPILGPETVRYQGILLYSSLILVSVALFAIRTIKIGDAAISVDRHVLLFYAVFIALISIVFGFKAYMDYKRANFFTGIATAAAMGEAQHLVQIGLMKRHIQNYYLFEFFDAVAKAYHRYSNADARLAGRKEADPPSSRNALLLDRVAIGRDPELAAELDRQERLYGPLNAELAADVGQFEQAALVIASSSSAQTDDEYQPYEERPRGRLQEPFIEWLRPWLDARNQIGNEHLDAVVANGDDSPEVKRLNAINSVLKQPKKIQFLYMLLEIVAPLVFALGAVVYAYSLG